MDINTFIHQNSDRDVNSLRLSMKKGHYDFDTELALTQIECRQKYRTKLHDFLENPDFLFPDTVSGEQASHQAVARYHASLAEGYSRILDMTAGLGIDAFSFAKTGAEVTAIELNPAKAEILKKNVTTLNLPNLTAINADSISYLKDDFERRIPSMEGKPLTTQSQDLERMTSGYKSMIFIDPARRDATNKRVYNLRDCSPDVLENQELLLKFAEKVLIKASPLLDITQTIKDFPAISAIRTVGVKGECKEVLIELSKVKPESGKPVMTEEEQETSKEKSGSGILLEAINLDTDGRILSKFQTRTSSSQTFNTLQSLPSNEPSYLLEPSAMVMKLAPWEEIGNRYNAEKLGKSSHLFITDTLPQEFPGRVTKILKVIKKQDRKSLAGLPASVISRNHPLKAEEIRKTFKLKEGDQYFIYATRIGDLPIIFLSERV